MLLSKTSYLQSLKRGIIAIMVVAGVLLGNSLYAQAPPNSNPGTPLEAILAQITIIQNQLVILQNEVADLADIRTDIANLEIKVATEAAAVKTTVEHEAAAVKTTVEHEVGDVAISVERIPDSDDLRGVTQNWDKKLDATNGEANGCDSDRFSCIWPDGNGFFTAVRDNETGEVWDRSPSSTNLWATSNSDCQNSEVGGRKGCHLPSIEQLMSLVDLNGTGTDGNGDDLKLPNDNPFIGIQASDYWTSTTDSVIPIIHYAVDFQDGTLDEHLRSVSNRVWCVRGGQHYDGQDNWTVIRDLEALH